MRTPVLLVPPVHSQERPRSLLIDRSVVMLVEAPHITRGHRLRGSDFLEKVQKRRLIGFLVENLGYVRLVSTVRLGGSVLFRRAFSRNRDFFTRVHVWWLVGVLVKVIVCYWVEGAFDAQFGLVFEQSRQFLFIVVDFDFWGLLVHPRVLVRIWRGMVNTSGIFRSVCSNKWVVCVKIFVSQVACVAVCIMDCRFLLVVYLNDWVFILEPIQKHHFAFFPSPILPIIIPCGIIVTITIQKILNKTAIFQRLIALIPKIMTSLLIRRVRTLLP